MKPRFLPYVFVLLMLLSGLVQLRYDSEVSYFAPKNTFVTLPSSKSLTIASFGFRNLVADLLFIWAIQFYSTYNLTNRFNYLERIFNTITDITPDYRDPYMIGSIIMALEAKDFNMAIRLLDKAALHFKDDWIFDYDAGYYAYKFLGDTKKAEYFYQRATTRPHAPSFLKRHAAHMVYLENNLNLALDMWRQIAAQAKDTFEKNSARFHLYQIKFEMDSRFIAEKVNRFQTRFNRYPRTLNELVRARIITAPEIPRDFFGDEYFYDPRQGKIKAQREFRWKKFS